MGNDYDAKRADEALRMIRRSRFKAPDDALTLLRRSRVKQAPPVPVIGQTQGPRRPSRAMRKTVFERDGGKCRQCGGTFDLQYDHVTPVAYGGPTTVENLQLLCGTCNQRKGKRRF